MVNLRAEIVFLGLDPGFSSNSVYTTYFCLYNLFTKLVSLDSPKPEFQNFQFPRSSICEARQVHIS